jgi:hypothetical protein
MKSHYWLLSVALFAIASCSKNNPATNLPTENTGTTGTIDVYVAGYSRNANNKTIATYWKNDVIKLLGKYRIRCQGYRVKGTDVYIAGSSKSN